MMEGILGEGKRSRRPLMLVTEEPIVDDIDVLDIADLDLSLNHVEYRFGDVERNYPITVLGSSEWKHARPRAEIDDRILGRETELQQDFDILGWIPRHLLVESSDLIGVEVFFASVALLVDHPSRTHGLVSRCAQLIKVLSLASSTPTPGCPT